MRLQHKEIPYLSALVFFLSFSLKEPLVYFVGEGEKGYARREGWSGWEPTTPQVCIGFLQADYELRS